MRPSFDSPSFPSRPPPVARSAVDLDPSVPKAHLRKAEACFALERYDDTRAAAAAGLALEPASAPLKLLLRKAEVSAC